MTKERRFVGILRAFSHLWERSQNSISLRIVWLCVSVYVAIAVTNLLGIIDRNTILSYLGLSYVGIIRLHLYYQFLTSPLLHGNLSHLLFNMLSIWMLGPPIEHIMGKKKYAVLSVIAGLSGMVAALAFSWGTGKITIGYSGVIYGILVAQAVYFPNDRIFMYGFFPMKMKYGVLLFAGIELYLTLFPGDGGVSNVSHLFGALGAFVYLRGYRLFRIFYKASGTKQQVRRTAASIRRARIEREIPRKL